MKMHKFSDTGTAYDCTQCGCTFEGGVETQVKNGDLLLIDTEQVVGVTDTWPFVVTAAAGKLHSLAHGVAVPIELRKQYGPQILRAVGQAILRGWPVRQAFLDLLLPIRKNMSCACCGTYTTGRQWGNRDDGYGLCNGCIDDCVTNPNDWLEAGCAYGIPGVHYDIDGAHYRAKAGA
jgi:hypothetical protein